ncbi:MAG TPA: DJ-1/PfpI family protein [Euzebyales bacterium]|nr:DJ-1/PfpI family protein [Euzebyales bacterium]
MSTEPRRDSLTDPGPTKHAADSTARTIAFVLYPGLTLFDLVGPLQVLTALTQTVPAYRTVVVAERVEPMDTDIPGTMKVVPNATFAEVPDPFAFIVPGGVMPTLRAMRNPAIRTYVRRAAETAEVVGSVCTGALILASVGLLEGRQATTHWAFSSVLEQLGATYVRRRWVEDGRFICSAGVSAGIDMALQLAARLTDQHHARDVQHRLGYDPEPPFGALDYDNIRGQLGAWRRGVRLAAPVIAARPKRLTRHGR